MTAGDDLAEAVWDACAAALVLVDRGASIVRVNRAFAELTGRAAADLAGRPAWDVLPVEVGLAALGDLAPNQPEGRLPRVPEQVLVDALGNRRRVAWRLAAVQQHGRVSHLLATGMDVTAERTQQATLRERAETDPLTGLANRASLLATLRLCLDVFRGAGCSVLFLDLDGFKAINDRHGHPVGDVVLQEVAARLSQAVRPDDVVARLGGDEFVLLVPAGGSFDARALAARVEKALGRPITAPGVADPLRVGVSIGCRTADPGEDPALVLQQADDAMYERKRRRKGRSVVA